MGALNCKGRSELLLLLSHRARTHSGPVKNNEGTCVKEASI